MSAHTLTLKVVSAQVDWVVGSGCGTESGDSFVRSKSLHIFVYVIQWPLVLICHLPEVLLGLVCTN